MLNLIDILKWWNLNLFYIYCIREYANIFDNIDVDFWWDLCLFVSNILQFGGIYFILKYLKRAWNYLQINLNQLDILMCYKLIS